jgi:hypothetical protein
MQYIVEFRKFCEVGDIVLIEYWYNKMIVPVKIIEKQGNKFLVSHNIETSKIKNAPDEYIKPNRIISKVTSTP